jgi:hypothetical protein
MAIYAIKDPNDDNRADLIYKSLKKGIARFGWSYHKNHDLLKINSMSWDEVDKIDSKQKSDMRYIWGKSSWLLNVVPDDYFVYINVPSYGECSLVKITSKYFFDETTNIDGDFMHACNLHSRLFIPTNRSNFHHNNEMSLDIQCSLGIIYT